MQNIRIKLTHLPKEPGVYFMKDAKGKVLYVGKAKDLKSRVSSYFVDAKDHSPKTRKLVRQIVDFEVMLVQTEVEALLLERTLIKHHQPPYNILLRDDKEYPYVRIHFREDWPRLEVVRRRKNDGAEYFGPFTAPGSLRQGLDAVYKVFPLIRCSPWEFKNAKRVCNYYHMKLCMGPCVLPVPKETYHAMLRDAMALLQGKNTEVLANIEERMRQAASHELYELAGQYRDQIKAIANLREKQSVIFAPGVSADVLGLVRSDELVVIHVLMVRDGKVMGGDSFTLSDGGSTDDNETLTHFLLQYYEGRDLPPRILIPYELESLHDLTMAITKESQQTTELKPIKNFNRAPWPALSAIALKNAQYNLDESVRTHDRARASLEALQSTLALDEIPRRIECIDISNLHGTAIVASDVCFIDGNPDKSQYRSYNIETVQGAPDDFASIFEVVKRRLERGIRDDNLPDLLVIDGGRGQLDSALKALAEFPGLALKIVSLAKSRIEKSGLSKQKGKVDTSNPRYSFERVFKPGSDTPIPLVPGSPAFRILTRLRDEAHRFAITKHRAKRAKLSSLSPLEGIAGIGPKLRAGLLIKFGSLEEIAKAPIDELLKIRGISEDLAVRIHSELNNH